MGVIIREWKRSICRHSAYGILMILVLTLCVFLSHAVWSDLYRIQIARETLVTNITDRTIYATFFSFTSDDFKRFETDDARIHIQSFVEALNKEPGIHTYDVREYREIEILSGLPELPDSFRSGYVDGMISSGTGDAQPISFFQVTDSFLDEFGMRFSEGKRFSPESFHYDINKPVEVVLGDAYREYIDLNDQFTASYEEETTFEVVGFLEKGTVFVGQSGFVQSVDHSILIPQFTSAGQTVYDNPEQFLRHVLIAADPHVVVEDDGIDVAALVNELAVRYDAFPLTVASVSLASANQIKSLTGQQQELSLIMTGVVFITIAATLVILISSRIRADLRVYAIYLLTGRSFRHIFAMLLLEHLVLVLIASIPALYLLGQADGLGLGGGMLEYLLSRIWIYVLILLAIVSGIVAAVLNRRNLIAPLRTLR